MSLKTFHIVFILLSVLLALGGGVWAVQDFLRNSKNFFNFGLGIVSLAGSAVLGYYLSWFLRKLRNLG